MIDKVVLRVSHYPGVNDGHVGLLTKYMKRRYWDNREFRNRLYVLKIRHDELPKKMDTETLPAVCMCPKISYFKGLFYACFNVRNLEKRLGLVEEQDPRLRCTLRENYIEYFREFDFTAKICAGCWSNQKYYDKYYGGSRTLP